MFSRFGWNEQFRTGAILMSERQAYRSEVVLGRYSIANCPLVSCKVQNEGLDGDWMLDIALDSEWR